MSDVKVGPVDESLRQIRLRNGALMPSIGMGTWHHGPKNEIQDALRFALNAGYRHIDCAKIYLNEKEVGEVFAQIIGKDIQREELFIVGKLWCTDHHPDHVEAACRKSLGELEIDYFDLYLIHWPVAFQHGEENLPKHESDGSLILDESIELMDTWTAMEKLVDVGLTRAIGLSNYNSKQITEIIQNCRIPPAVLHAECNPRFSNEALRQFCERNGIVMIAFSPFGSPDLPWGEKLPHILEENIIKEIAESLGRTPALVVLRWLLQRRVATIPKSVIEHELSENLKVYDFTLSYDEMSQINGLNRNIRKIVPVVKLKSGEIVIRDLKSRHYSFAFEEKLTDEE